jgi:hypothetical protein
MSTASQAIAGSLLLEEFCCVLLYPRLQAIVVTAVSHIVKEGFSGVKVGGDLRCIDYCIFPLLLSFLEVYKLSCN